MVLDQSDFPWDMTFGAVTRRSRVRRYEPHGW
jgi:hypothetical protein